MPDDEFTRIPSIEIFYTGGTGLDNHFQYLTRTNYDDETRPTCPPTRNATLPPDSHMEINDASLPVEEILVHPETVIPSQITEVESPATDSIPKSQSTLSQISAVMENKKLSAVVKKMYLAKNVNIRSLFPTKPPNRKETEETNKATDDDDIQSVTPPRHNNFVVRSSDAYREIFVEYNVKKAFELDFTTTRNTDVVTLILSVTYVINTLHHVSSL